MPSIYFYNNIFQKYIQNVSILNDRQTKSRQDFPIESMNIFNFNFMISYF